MIVDRWKKYFEEFLGNDNRNHEIEQEINKIPAEREEEGQLKDKYINTEN